MKNHNENFRNSQTNDIHTNWKDMVARERERARERIGGVVGHLKGIVGTGPRGGMSREGLAERTR